MYSQKSTGIFHVESCIKQKCIIVHTKYEAIRVKLERLCYFVFLSCHTFIWTKKICYNINYFNILFTLVLGNGICCMWALNLTASMMMCSPIFISIVADYYTYVAELCTEKDPDPAGSGYFKQHLGYVSCRNILKF